MIYINFVLGTRPEINKCAALALALSRNSEVRLELYISGQQGQSVITSLKDLGLVERCSIIWLIDTAKDTYLPDWQQRAERELLSRWERERPNAVVVQGDTFTARLGAEAAEELKILVCHLEAGVRHHSVTDLEPEEINRRLITRIAALHFAPTEREKNNLIAEGVLPDQIIVSGDLNFGALSLVHAQLPVEAIEASSLSVATKTLNADSLVPSALLNSHYILCTFHRPSTLTHSDLLAERLRELAKTSSCKVVLCRRPDTRWNGFFSSLEGIENIVTIPSLPPTVFQMLTRFSELIITDSAGVQQEALILGKNVIVTRHQVELYQNHERLWLLPPPFNYFVDTCMTVLASVSIWTGFRVEWQSEGDGIANLLLEKLRYSLLA